MQRTANELTVKTNAAASASPPRGIGADGLVLRWGEDPWSRANLLTYNLRDQNGTGGKCHHLPKQSGRAEGAEAKTIPVNFNERLLAGTS